MFFQATPRVSARAAWYSVLRYRQIGTSPGSVVKSRKVAPTMKVEGRQTVHAKGRRAAERAREQRAADLRLRDSTFWMLHEAGASYAAIARGAGISSGRVRQVCQDYAYQLHRRTEYLTGAEPFMERLRRAGALLGAAAREGGTILEPRFDPRSFG